MEDVLQQARRLKGEAMDARDDERFDVADGLLRDAENALVVALQQQQRSRGDEPVGELECEIAKQLVHIRGSRGGVYRRVAQRAEPGKAAEAYAKAARAYDSGYEYERPESIYGIVDSYTLVQRLVTRVLIDPAAADDASIVVEQHAVRAELENARDVVHEQIYVKKVRERDDFAHADLTLVLALLGDGGWRLQLRRFRDLQPGFSLSASREVVEELCGVAAASPRASERLLGDLTALLAGLQ